MNAVMSTLTCITSSKQIEIWETEAMHNVPNIVLINQSLIEHCTHKPVKQIKTLSFYFLSHTIQRIKLKFVLFETFPLKCLVSTKSSRIFK